MPRSTSLWVQTSGRLEAEPLRADAAADVCVVGAGIAGVTTAYLLARDHRSVILIDERGVGAGQTAMTTAHLSDAIDDTYQEIVRLHGPNRGRLAAQSHRTAIDCIEPIASMLLSDAIAGRPNPWPRCTTRRGCVRPRSPTL